MICKDCGYTYDGTNCPACGSNAQFESKAVNNLTCATQMPQESVQRSCNVATKFEGSWETTFAETERAMAVLYALSGEECSKGTGFFVRYEGEEFCVTNYHVISEGETIVAEMPQIVDVSKQKYNTDVLAVDELNDLALLQLQVDSAGIANFPERRSLALSDLSDVSVGQEVCTRGNPRYYTNILTVGRISGICESSAISALGHFGANRFLVNIEASNGNSGGAVCNKRGEVVGAITCQDKEMPGQIICVTAFAIKQLIASYVAKRNQNK